MGTERERTWLQCTNCGHIHIVERKIPFEVTIVRSYCKLCENDRALNCGHSEDDVELLRDVFLDYRYY